MLIEAARGRSDLKSKAAPQPRFADRLIWVQERGDVKGEMQGFLGLRDWESLEFIPEAVEVPERC